jgi:predicted adenine nucleotide alpha hydrolase (AANH) superfamily ATPase
LRQEYDISAFFFNPNIHPFLEFKKRREALLAYCHEQNIPVLDSGEYGLEKFLRRVVFREQQRCLVCYSWRMEQTARTASERGFDGFSTTLLYSRYQNHEQLKECGIALAKKYTIEFIYRDFREGWQIGIDKSRELGMYRQPYCGCIYSEQDRYDKKRSATNNSK